MPRSFARWGIAAAIVVALVAGGYALFARNRAASARTASVPPPEPSVAVLPFENIGGDASNEPFSDGVAEDLTTELRKLARLNVKARTSAFSFKGKDLTGQEVGRRLGAQYVVTGSVQLSGSRRRVNAQLIDVATGNELWSDRYDSETSADNVFAVQDTITRAIVTALRVPLSATESASLDKRPTTNREAHDLYLLGRFFFDRRDSISLVKAKDYFEQAIAKDPAYARAYAGLSDAYSHNSAFGYLPPRAVHGKAKAAALHALALDSLLVEGHVSRGFVALFLEWDFETARRAFDRAIELDPRYAPAHQFRGWYLIAANEPEKALDEMRTAVRLDPFSVVINARLATMLYYARQYDDAIAQARHTLELDSLSFNAFTELIRVLAAAGRCGEALDVLARNPQVAAGPFQGLEGNVYARCGNRSRALEQLARVEKKAAAGNYLASYGLVDLYWALGDTARTFSALSEALEDRAWILFALQVDPAFDSLRQDPRFSRILARVGVVSRSR